MVEATATINDEDSELAEQAGSSGSHRSNPADGCGDVGELLVDGGGLEGSIDIGRREVFCVTCQKGLDICGVGVSMGKYRVPPTCFGLSRVIPVRLKMKLGSGGPSPPCEGKISTVTRLSRSIARVFRWPFYTPIEPSTLDRLPIVVVDLEPWTVFRWLA